MKKERIAYLDHMRAVAIVMVICIHALGYGHPLTSLQTKYVLFVVLPIAVPVFFFVDGLLLVTRLGKGRVEYVPFVKKSAFRLLFPWVLFTLLYTFLRYCFEVAGVLQVHLVLGQGLPLVAARAYMSTYAPQMYFLMSLFFIRAALPLVRRLFYELPLILSAAVAVALAAAYNISGLDSVLPFNILQRVSGQEPVLHALYGLQFYALGMVAGRVQGHVSLEKLVWPAGLIFVATAAARLAFGGSHWWVSFFYLIFFYAFFVSFRPSLPGLSVIGKNTMGIYLLHTPLILKAVSGAVGAVVPYPFTGFLLTVVVTGIFSLVAAYCLKRLPYGPVLLGTPYAPVSGRVQG